MNDKELNQQVLKALDNKEYTYRTIVGIGKELNISEEKILESIRNNPYIKKAIVPSKSGKNYYCKKEYRMLGKEIVSFLHIALLKPEINTKNKRVF